MYVCKKCGGTTFISQLKIFNKKGIKATNKSFNKVACANCGNIGERLKDIANRRNKDVKYKRID